MTTCQLEVNGVLCGKEANHMSHRKLVCPEHMHWHTQELMTAAMPTFPDRKKISDGYHTFEELYEHRHALYIALCYERKENTKVWRSKLHSDGTMFEGMFVLGLGKQPGYQITYHLPLSKWGLTAFAETLDIAPPYDGHTSDDVLKRLSDL